MKKIKFALLLGDKPCRSLEDIRENFNAYDIIKNFDTGVLLNWLKTYNLDELYNKAILIDKNSETKLNDLLDLFFEDNDNRKKELLNKYKEEILIQEEIRKKEEEKILEAEKQKQLEEERKKSYESLTNSIIENKTNYDFVKSTISSNYKILMENYSDFFERLKSSKCIFGILSVLSNEDTRDYFLNDKNIMDSIKNDVIGVQSYKIGGFYSMLLAAFTCRLCIFGEWYRDISEETTEYYYVFNKIKTYSESTFDTFSLLVENKKCLIIYLDPECSITSSVNRDKVYTADDINDKFLILDGIIIKRNGVVIHDDVIYMEI